MPDKIFLIEDHHQALDIWRREGFKNLPLVHLDAHIDFGFYQANPVSQVIQEAKSVADLKKQLETTLLYQKYQDNIEAQLNIGNYIYPAMRDGIVKDFCWVIPGDKKNFSQGLKHLGRYQNHFTTTTLFSAKKIAHPILLDIDVDFALFASRKKISLTEKIGQRQPWILPQEEVALIREKFPNPACITIAYSVNGGFTPPEYKFFGDEIYLRLNNLVDDELEAIFSLRNEGMKKSFENDLRVARDFFLQAINKLAEYKKLDNKCEARFFAHLHFWLFSLHWKLKAKTKARKYYQQLLTEDPSYRVKDNNLGPLYFNKGDYRSAQSEFAKIIYCDKKDYFAWCGLGDISFRSKHYKIALGHYQQALKINPQGKEALYGIASCSLALNNLRGADKALSPLEAIDHFSGQRWLLKARLNKKLGNLGQALDYYKEAVLLGMGGIEIYVDVFRILKRKKDAILFEFFRQKYQAYRDDFYKRQKKLLLKKKQKAQVDKIERAIRKIAKMAE